ncbi:MAG: efflux RND transporter periplasmic adaptor subunit [Candidatus Muirbacterium halophilum]|nr:efflux RND transporter periplasmic adaptor subunit [Candidatus Muirbacterium halophilum]MCK9475018.1 efflux RND transporter periplasmic adaptor subunit [Candidatus Muirbacterium halophilum]
MKKGNAKLVFAGVVIVILVVLGVFLSKKNKITKKDINVIEEKKINVNVKMPERGNIGNEVVFNGEVKAMQEYILSSRIGEKIKSFYVENGQNVKKGDIIVELDEVNYTQQFRKAEASLKSAQTNYNISKKDYDRSAILYEKKVINDKAFDSVKNSFQRAQESLIQSEAQYEMSKRDFESLKIKAPYDGIVVDRNGNPGQLISPGFVFGRVLNIDKIDVETYISAEQVNSIKIGSKAEIKGLLGEVSAINRAADKNSRNFLVKIRFDNKDYRFIEGSFAQGFIYIDYYENVLLIPNNALLYDANGYFIFVNNNGKAKKIDVKIKAKDKEKVYVTDMNENLEIIVSGQSILKENSLINISEE